MRGRSFWTDGPGSFLLAVVLALTVRWAIFEAYVIPSPSMLPTLLVNDHIFVDKLSFGLRVPFTEKWLVRWGEPKRGDVVVFKHPQDLKLFFVKRVVGLPGDRIFYENGNLYVNDQLVTRKVPDALSGDWQWVNDSDFPGEAGQGGRQNYTHWEESIDNHEYSVLVRNGSRSEPGFGPYTVPPEQFFVIGDNRDNSEDSRGWAPGAERATGKVIFQRSKEGPPIVIPAGTQVRTDQPGTWAQRYRTLSDITLEANPVEVEVRAVEPGSLGNVAGEAIVVVEGSLQEAVTVRNPQALTGGDDKRFVPRNLLVGRASRVWLSCEKKLPVAEFLCHPFHIRWSRIFHAIN